MLNLLAQSEPLNLGPTTSPPPPSPGQTGTATTQSYYVNTYWWFERVPRTDTALQAIGVLLLVPIVGFMLQRMFRGYLSRNCLHRPLAIATVAIAFYAAVWVVKMRRMLDEWDILAQSIHRVFFAVMLLVGLRFLDRLVVHPLLTRGGRVTLPRFVHQIIMGAVYAFTTLAYCSTAFGWNINGFLAGSAVLSIVLGLALQETLGNFFSGMVMQASSPFVPGDWIDCGGIEGRVVDMTWRSVTLHTAADNYVLIPNSLIAKERIVNYHHPTRATVRSVKIGLDYAIPPHEARAVLLQAIHDTPGVLSSPEPGVALASFDDSAVTYSVFFWIDKPEAHAGIETQVRTNIWYRVKQAGLNIPFPTRTVQTIDLERRQAEERRESRAARQAMLRRAPLLRMLSDEQVAKLADDAHDFVLTSGQVVYRQGEAGDTFYILQEGSVEGLAIGAEGKEVRVNTIEQGNFFGEAGALLGTGQPTTVRALTAIKCLAITREHLQELFAADPELMGKISEVVAQRAAEREARLKAAGAAVAHPAGQPHSVLDRMKRVFGKMAEEVSKVGKMALMW